ncbi:hypothetical protein FTO70_10530 [Methanosarcina sp. KYL-1]|uniref:hypothetical protein n=1 Tax=Methanosarcina sp. KYL-1 TaxID=2602068 RepID=UPI0021011224|nr:hypothetical protein [Methanosarcina sp. KYL-1]MCQ1536106.1 hypothetical protein [Methanosarcina sp. KYL-1]
MFWNKNNIVEKISEIPLTLDDISEDLFGGVSTNNGFLHRVGLPGKNDPADMYMCEGLCVGVNIEPELVYPYVSGALSGKYAVRSSPQGFMLPYSFSGSGPRKECRVLQPSELEAEFPLAYYRVMDFKANFHHDSSPLGSPDYYSVRGTKLLEYLNTPKIIVNEGYRMQAAYDEAGKHLFREGCGIVLKDPEMYHYVTAVLNSPVARLFPAVCRYRMVYCDTLTPSVLKRFPMAFPENEAVKNLISTLSSYLILIHRQKYAAAGAGASGSLRELAGFYEEITNRLVLDTYLGIEPAPKLLDILEENIHPYAGEMEWESCESLLSAMQYVKQEITSILNTEKCGLDLGLPDVLSLP